MLSISDWIRFLTSEKNPNIAIIISFSAVWMAIFGVVTSATSDTLLSSIIGGVMFAVLAAIYLRTIGPFTRGAKRAAALLKDIMTGKERDPSRIEERWN